MKPLSRSLQFKEGSEVEKEEESGKNNSCVPHNATPNSPTSPLCEPCSAVKVDDESSGSDDDDYNYKHTEPTVAEQEENPDQHPCLEATHNHPSQSSFAAFQSEEETDPGGNRQRSTTTYRYYNYEVILNCLMEVILLL